MPHKTIRVIRLGADGAFYGGGPGERAEPGFEIFSAAESFQKPGPQDREVKLPPLPCI